MSTNNNNIDDSALVSDATDDNGVADAASTASEQRRSARLAHAHNTRGDTTNTTGATSAHERQTSAAASAATSAAASEPNTTPTGATSGGALAPQPQAQPQLPNSSALTLAPEAIAQIAAQAAAAAIRAAFERVSDQNRQLVDAVVQSSAATLAATQRRADDDEAQRNRAAELLDALAAQSAATAEMARIQAEAEATRAKQRDDKLQFERAKAATIDATNAPLAAKLASNRTFGDRTPRSELLDTLDELVRALETLEKPEQRAAKLLALLGGTHSTRREQFLLQIPGESDEQRVRALEQMLSNKSEWRDFNAKWRQLLLASIRAAPPSIRFWPAPQGGERLRAYAERIKIIRMIADLAGPLCDKIAAPQSDAPGRDVDDDLDDRQCSDANNAYQTAQLVAVTLCAQHLELFVPLKHESQQLREELGKLRNIDEVNKAIATHGDVTLSSDPRGGKSTGSKSESTKIKSYAQLPRGFPQLRARVELRAEPLGARSTPSDAPIETAALADLGGAVALVRADLVPNAARVRRAPPIVHLELADGSTTTLARPTRPIRLRIRIDGQMPKIISAYPVPNLPEPLVLGDASLSELGGVQINVPRDIHDAIQFEWAESDQTHDQIQQTHHDSTNLNSKSLVALRFDIGEIEIYGDDLVRIDGESGRATHNLHGDEITSAFNMLSVATDALNDKDCETKSARRRARKAAWSKANAVAARVWMPDLASPYHDPGIDAAPIPSSTTTTGAHDSDPDEPNSYRLPNATAKLFELIDSNSNLSADQRRRFKERVAAIPNLTLSSKEAPPTPYGPVRGAGSIHHIRLRPNANPNDAFTKRRHYSYKKQRVMDEAKQAWLQFDIVEPTAPGATRAVSQPVVAPKHDADHNVVGYRVAVDFRKLNDLTIKDRYAPPLLSDVLQFTAKANYVNVWDAKSLFHQFELAPESRPLTNTQWYDGSHFVWKRAPFGLASILATAQRWSDTHLASPNRQVYVDDAIDAGDSVEHAIDLAVDFLERAAALNLCIGVDKAQLITQNPTVLGHDVDCTRHTYAPHASRLEAMLSYRRPASNAGLRRFLNKGAYWGRFVPGWSAMQRRLASFIKYNQPLQWDEQKISAFYEARLMFAKVIELSVFDPNKRTRLYADGSGSGLGFIGAQVGEEGHERPIFCGGRSTAQYERRLHANELEMLAFREALRKFPHMLIGTPGGTTLVTDSAATSKFRKRAIKAESDAVNRFLIELQFGDLADIDIELVRSANNPADADSRQFDEPDPDADPNATPEYKAMLRRALEAAQHRIADTSPDATGGHNGDINDAHKRQNTTAVPARVMRVVDADDDNDDVRDATEGVGVDASSIPALAPLTPVLEIDSDEIFPEPEANDDPTPHKTRPPATEIDADDEQLLPEPPDAEQSLQHEATEAERHVHATGGYPVLNRDRLDIAQQTAVDGTTWARDLALAADGRAAPRRATALLPARDALGRIFVRPRGLASAPRLYLPPSARTQTIALAHAARADGGAHRRVASTVAKLAERVWFPAMHREVQAFIDKCSVCQQLADGPPDAFLGTDVELPGRFAHVHVDLADIERSAAGTPQQVLVVVDRATGALEYASVQSKAAEHVIDAFERCWLRRYGVPARVTVDNDKPLVSEAMRSTAATHGFELDPTASRNAQGNGMVERAIRTFKAAVRAYTPFETRPDTESDWRAQLDDARWSYWTAVAQTRKHSPFELTFGVKPVLALDRQLKSPVAQQATIDAQPLPNETYAQYYARMSKEARERAEAALDESDIARAHRHEYDKNHKQERARAKGGVERFAIGDIVWLKNTQNEFRTKFKNKLRRTGPYEVLKVDERRNRYKVGDWRSQLVHPGWISIHRLSPCTARVELADVQRDRNRSRNRGGDEHEERQRRQPDTSTTNQEAHAVQQQQREEQQAPQAQEPRSALEGPISVEYDDPTTHSRRRVMDMRHSVDGLVALVQQQRADGSWAPTVVQVLMDGLPAHIGLAVRAAKRKLSTRARRTTTTTTTEAVSAPQPQQTRTTEPNAQSRNWRRRVQQRRSTATTNATRME